MRVERGFSEEVARNLIRLGYKVDTSVFPVWDWNPGPDFRSFSHKPFVYTHDAESDGSLLEVPATVDFLQSRRELACSIFHSIERFPLGPKMLGGLSRLGLLNRVCLSPEVSRVADMIRLTEELAARGGTQVLNFFFHSPTLLEGCTPFAATPVDVQAFLKRIDEYLTFAVSAGFKLVTLSELTAPGAWAFDSVTLDTGSESLSVDRTGTDA